MARMKYRDNMTPEETAQLLADTAALDAAYADADFEAANSANESADAEEIEAAHEQSLDYFNHYIAGDRK
jgi:hypothetical protein